MGKRTVGALALLLIVASVGGILLSNRREPLNVNHGPKPQSQRSSTSVSRALDLESSTANGTFGMHGDANYIAYKTDNENVFTLCEKLSDMQLRAATISEESLRQALDEIGLEDWEVRRRPGSDFEVLTPDGNCFGLRDVSQSSDRVIVWLPRAIGTLQKAADLGFPSPMTPTAAEAEVILP